MPLYPGPPAAKLAAAEQAARVAQRERDSLVFSVGKLELEVASLRWGLGVQSTASGGA